MQTAQRLAAEVVSRVVAGQSLTPALAEVRQRRDALQLSPHERALIQDLCYGTLRFLGEARAYASALADDKLTDPLVAALVHVAIYQLLHTRAAPHAVVDHAVGAVALLGRARAKTFINAVLRNFLRQRESLSDAIRQDETAAYSYPAWWIAKAKEQYPEAWQALLHAGNLHPPMTLRVNTRSTTREAYAAGLAARGLAALAVGEQGLTLTEPVSVDELPEFSDGWVSVQDASAQRAAVLLDAQDGMRVLDACAAPGGKTGHILERSSVDMLALDRNAARLRQVEQNLHRLGLSAALRHADAAETASWWDGRPFDRILLDVPCSASGVVKRHPDVKWLRRAADIQQFAAQQRRLLEALWPCLGAHGRLLYASCSVFGEENAGQIAGFLGRHAEAHTLPVPMSDNGQITPDELRDGFFYALLEKH